MLYNVQMSQETCAEKTLIIITGMDLCRIFIVIGHKQNSVAK